MKPSGFVLTIALTALAVFALPGVADQPGATISQAGLFSYQAPPGWTTQNSSLSKYPIAASTGPSSFAANLNVVVESSSATLAEYVARNKKVLTGSPAFTGLQIVDEKSFQTSAGIQGVRLVVKDTLNKSDLQQIFYFFAGSSNNKFVLTGTCLSEGGDQMAPVFDASARTFSPQ